MNLTQFSADDLQRITEIVRKKEEHLKAASALDRELSQIGVSGVVVAQQVNGTRRQLSAPVPAGLHQGVTLAHPGWHRGAVKEQMIEALRNAGPAGITARDLAMVTKRTRVSNSSWLTTYQKRGVVFLHNGRWHLKVAAPHQTEVSRGSARSKKSMPHPTRDIILAVL